MAFVLDPSLAAAWFLEDESSAVADRLAESLSSEPAMIPSLFWFEMRSLLLTAERRGRLKPGEALLCMMQLRNYPLDDAGQGLDQSVFDLAGRFQLSAYDATYLALALDRNLSLATADRKLAAAAHASGTQVLGPFAQK